MEAAASALLNVCHWLQPTQVPTEMVLFNYRSFYDMVIHLAEQENPVDVILEDFGRSFQAISHSTLLDRMYCIWLDRNITW